MGTSSPAKRARIVDVIEEGDIFKSKAQTLVNTVNTVGVMGKGIALGFKTRFPDMYEDYAQRCREGRVRLGRPYLFRRPEAPWIINFPTKEHWRSVARLDAIIEGLEYLEHHYRAWGVSSLAVPPLGCGEGHLEWRVVGPTLYRHLSLLDIPVELYAPFGTPHEELQPQYLEQLALESVAEGRAAPRSRIRSGWAALVAILRRIEQEPYHYPIGRISFQKLAYFATQAGIPTGLEHHRGSYGPFSHQLRSVVTRLVNNGLLREEQLGQMFAVRTGRTYKDAAVAFEKDLDSWSEAIERVADLMARMNGRRAEAAATVHYAAQQVAERLGRMPTESEVLDVVRQWKQRRRPPLTEGELAAAIRTLGMLGWLELKASRSLPLDEAELVGSIT